MNATDGRTKKVFHPLTRFALRDSLIKTEKLSPCNRHIWLLKWQKMLLFHICSDSTAAGSGFDNESIASGFTEEPVIVPLLQSGWSINYSTDLLATTVSGDFCYLVTAEHQRAYVCTGPKNNTCLWFGELFSCCCLPLLPQLAYNIIETTYKHYFWAQ